MVSRQWCVSLPSPIIVLQCVCSPIHGLEYLYDRTIMNILRFKYFDSSIFQFPNILILKYFKMSSSTDLVTHRAS